VADRFHDVTGQPADGVWRAPGRVNLIGEHTDYNAGLALPFAIDRATAVAVRRRADRRMRCWSSHDHRPADVDLDAIDRAALPPWARYPVGVLWSFARAGLVVPGVDILVESTVPVGSGLSSSAALEAAVAVAVDDLNAMGLDRRRLVDLCHAAETDFVGAPVGMLDQFAVLYGRADHGLLLDFRFFEASVEEIPLRIGPLVVVDTRVRHSNAEGAYAARRRSCRAAALALGVAHLRDATPAEVAARLDGELRRRARHVVSENERVVSAAGRLRAGEGIGDLMFASHASLRDDFEVSCPELDAVVETAAGLGAAGARLTGAGFGGSAIVLGLSAADLEDGLAQSFSRRGLAHPDVFAVAPSPGAGRLL